MFPSINQELWQSTFGEGTTPMAVAPKDVSWWDSLRLSAVEKPPVATSQRAVGQQIDGRQHAEGEAGKKAGLAASLIQKAANTYQQRPPEAAHATTPPADKAEPTRDDGKPGQGSGIAALLKKAKAIKPKSAVDPATSPGAAAKEDAKAAAKDPASPDPATQKAAAASPKAPPVPTDRARSMESASNTARSGSVEPALNNAKGTATSSTSAEAPKETGAVQQLLKLMLEQLYPLVAALLLSLAAALTWLVRSGRRMTTEDIREEGQEMEEEDIRSE